MVTYENLVQTAIFIVALIGLCFQIFRNKRKKITATSRTCDGYKIVAIHY